MEMKLIVLKLFLDELGIGSEIDTFDERKSIQKAVYLGQLTGADLSYRFGWYLKGPYSPSLAEDYYHLADELEVDSESYQKYQLKKSLRDKLKKIQPLLEVPKKIRLLKKEWLELLASCDYLRRVRKLSNDKADEVLKKEKPELYEYAHRARKVLRETPL